MSRRNERFKTTLDSEIVLNKNEISMRNDMGVNMKYLFCDCAEANTGKTTFLLSVVDKLLSMGYCCKIETDLRNINNPIKYAGNGADRWVVLEKDNGKKIIVQTEGDYQVSFKNTSDYILKNNDVDVIICASRLDSAIKGKVLNFSGYKVHFFQHIISGMFYKLTC